MAWGALASVGIGLAGQLLQNKFGSKKRVGSDLGYDPALLAARQGEISKLGESLTASRQSYLNSLSNLNNTTLQRFVPRVEAQLAGSGKSIAGGAYASALAKETAGLSASLMPKAFEQENSDLRFLDNQRASAFSSAMTGASESAAWSRNRNAAINDANAGDEGAVWGAATKLAGTLASNRLDTGYWGGKFEPKLNNVDKTTKAWADYRIPRGTKSLRIQSGGMSSPDDWMGRRH